MSAAELQDKNQPTPLDYRCKQCETMSTAETFDMIVKREKLCVDCIIKNAREKQGLVGVGIIRAAKPNRNKISRLKYVHTNKKEYICVSCGLQVNLHIKPHKCECCGSKAFNQIKNKEESNNG